MEFHSAAIYLDNKTIIADIYTGRSFSRGYRAEASFDSDPSEVAALLTSQIDNEEAPQMIVCPGGLFKPLSQGAYLIDRQLYNEARQEAYGHHVNNYLMLVCAELSKSYSVPAIMIDPVSSDDLLPTEKITSIPTVLKKSRYHACEHNALLSYACLENNKHPEETKAIVVWLDDIVSVGARRNGECVEVNDAFGGEGPMGFRSSGDVPVAPLSDLYFGQGLTADQLWRKLNNESGVFGYTGIDDPTELDNAINGGNLMARTVVGAVAYQTAKWIGMCTFALQGEVDFIVIGGKGATCNYLKHELRMRIEKIAPAIFIEKSSISRYLAEKACLVHDDAVPLMKY